MKKYLLFILAVLWVNLKNYAQENELISRDLPVMNDSNPDISLKVKAALGELVVQNLLNADSIETFWLEGYTNDLSRDGIQGFKMISQGPLLTVLQTAVLQEIVTNEANYYFDGIAKSCDFHPDIAFRFSNGMSILASLSCNIWRFYPNNDVLITHDLDKAHSQAVNLSMELFPLEFSYSYLDNRPDNNVENNNNISSRDKVQLVQLPLPELLDIEMPYQPVLLEADTAVIHKVKANESLYKIAKQYGVKIEELKAWNDKEDNLILVDEELVVRR